MELWELIARERIRDTLARYTWSGDALRVEEMVGAFSEDGVLAVRGSAELAGRDAIAAFIGGVGSSGPAPDTEAGGSTGASAGVRRIVRHNVANVRFVELGPDRARVESYFTVFTEIGLDHLGRYRDEFVPVGDEWLIRRREVSTDWRSPDSTMAAPSSVR